MTSKRICVKKIINFSFHLLRNIQPTKALLFLAKYFFQENKGFDLIPDFSKVLSSNKLIIRDSLLFNLIQDLDLTLYSYFPLFLCLNLTLANKILFLKSVSYPDIFTLKLESIRKH